ncbi:ataxin-2 isoform X3 [Piliocolobus tephrosceles]|uniref:ataxin-2 isoform X3 n=1 Tax=Piliocolobus tephrosceles TaxID=591936 RepID=UPI000E6B11AC|nr:ataxin-2 isoform X3 [Piliocolobus tephrosceles]
MRSVAEAPRSPAAGTECRPFAAAKWPGWRSLQGPAPRSGRGGGGGAASGQYPSAAPPPPGPGPPPSRQRSPPSASDCFGCNGNGGGEFRPGSPQLLGLGGPPRPFVVLLLPLGSPSAPPAAPTRASPLSARASPPRSGVSSARPAPGCPRPACEPVYGPLTMSLKPQQQQQQQQPQQPPPPPPPAAANVRKPGGSGLLASPAAAPSPSSSSVSSSSATTPSSAAAATSGGGRPGLGRGRNSNKGLPQSTISFDGIYANMRMVHILTSVVGSKCEVQVKNGGIYEGVFKTYSPKCDLVLDAAHEKSTESSSGPKREEIMESILFKCSDFVVVQFKDMDSSYAKRDAFTDSAISAKVNGEHKEKDLEPWDAGELTANEELEALENDVSNGWDPNDMFRYNEENYGVVSTYDSSLSSYTVPLERDNSEEFLKREARANQLAEEIESSAQYKARVALENDDRSEEEKYTAVQRNSSEREGHSINTRENKYIPPGQRNREVISWGSGRQNSPRMGQPGSGSMPSRSTSHTSDFNPNSGSDQRVVNGGVPWPSPCPSPSSRPPSRYQSGPNSLPPRAATPTRPPSRPPSRPSRPPSHPSAHGSPAPVSTMPKRMSSEGPPRMSPKAQRHPRNHRVSAGRGSISSGLEFVSHNPPSEAATPPVARTSPSGGTWSSVVSGVPRLSPKTHRPRSPRQNSIGNTPSGPVLASPQAGIIPTEAVAMPIPAASPTPASPASNRAVTPSSEAKDSRLQDQRQNSPAGNKENIKPNETSPSFSKAENKGISPIVSEHRKQIDDLKKFKNDFRLQPSSTSESMDQLLNKNREGEKSRDLIKDKIEPSAKDSFTENSSSNCTSGSSKPNSPSISPSILSNTEHKRGPEVTSQGVQTSSPACKQEKDDKEEKKDAAEQVRKSTLNPNAKEFNPRSFSQPKPSTTPTSPRPQAQPSPSMVGHQQPTPVYTQPVCFAPNMMYPVPVSPGVQPLYPIPMTPMPVNQAKTYRAGKVPNMPQQRQDQHHQSAMMHPASAAGPPIAATPPAYSTQYVAYSPQQFPNQPLVQHVPHYQSQHPHVYSPVIQGNARMMAPPTHAQPGLVSSSATQYGAHEQTHAMYACPKLPYNKETSPSFYFAISTGSLAQQYAHPNATLHPHTPHPQPSATPTGQQQSQHGGSHPAPSPVQHHQHQAAQALHLASPQQQSAIYHAGLAPTPPSMTPASNTQSPQNSFPAAQQTVFTIHPSHVQPAYTNPPHMAHVPQCASEALARCGLEMRLSWIYLSEGYLAHVQSGMVPSHPTAHAPMMLMTTQPPGGPQAALAQSALQPIPVSTTAHFPYMTHPSGEACVCRGRRGTPKHSARTGGMAGRASASSPHLRTSKTHPGVCTGGTVTISLASGPEASGSRVCVCSDGIQDLA